MRSTLLGIALLAGAVAPLHAQRDRSDTPRPPRERIEQPRGFAGGALQVATPLGEFKNTTDNSLGFGVAGHLLVGVDPNAILNWRVDASFLTYGNVTQRVPLSPTLGSLIRVDLRTSNNILNVVTGPQLLAPTGAIAPYVNALGGASVFWTTSTVEGTNNNDDFASTTNASDVSWSYGGSAGLYIRLTNGARPLSLDLGARYLRQDDAKYLTRQQIRDAVAAQRPFDNVQPTRTRADFVTYYAGVSAVIF
jgi:hypothetical protein